MTPLMLLGTVIAALTLCAAIMVVTSRVPIHAACFLILTLVGVAAEYVLLEAHTLAVLQILVYAGAIVVLIVFVLMLMGSGPKDEEPVGLGTYRAVILGGLAFVMVSLAYAGREGWLPPVPVVGLEALALIGAIPAFLLVPGPDEEKAKKGSFRVATGSALAVGLLVFFGQALGTQGVAGASRGTPSDYGEVAPLGELLLGPYVFSFEVISLLLMVAIIGAVALLRKRDVVVEEEEAGQ